MFGKMANINYLFNMNGSLQTISQNLIYGFLGRENRKLLCIVQILYRTPSVTIGKVLCREILLLEIL